MDRKQGAGHTINTQNNEGMTRHTWNQISTMRTGTGRTKYGQTGMKHVTIMLYADPGNPRRVPRHVIVHLNANKYTLS